MIDSVEPSSGPVGTSPVTLRGTALSGTEVKVYFGDALSVATGLAADGSWIETVVPTGARSGPVHLLLDGVRVDGPTFTVTDQNPRPNLTSASPPKVERGSPRTRVALGGTGFLAESVVRFDGETLPVDSWSPTSLTVLLDATRLAAPANHAFTVENGPPGGGVSAPVAFSVWEPFNLRSVRSTSRTSVEVEFDSPPDPVGALDQTLYTFSSGLEVVRAEQGPTEETIELTTGQQTSGMAYTVTVSHDLSSKYGAELGIDRRAFTGY